PRSDSETHRNQQRVLANIGVADEYQPVVWLDPRVLAPMRQPSDTMLRDVARIELVPVLEPAHCLRWIAEPDRGRQVRIVGPRSSFLDPAVVDQQLVLDH